MLNVVPDYGIFSHLYWKFKFILFANHGNGKFEQWMLGSKGGQGKVHYIIPQSVPVYINSEIFRKFGNWIDNESLEVSEICFSIVFPTKSPRIESLLLRQPLYDTTLNIKSESAPPKDDTKKTQEKTKIPIRIDRLNYEAQKFTTKTTYHKRMLSKALILYPMWLTISLQL